MSIGEIFKLASNADRIYYLSFDPIALLYEMQEEFALNGTIERKDIMEIAPIGNFGIEVKMKDGSKMIFPYNVFRIMWSTDISDIKQSISIITSKVSDLHLGIIPEEVIIDAKNSIK